MASEGMDIPKLNTIVLASPKSDIVQSVGRILREKAEKRKFHPLIIDIQDCHENLGFFKRQSQKRISYYQSQNYDVKSISPDGTIQTLIKKKRSKKKQATIVQCLIDDD